LQNDNPELVEMTGNFKYREIVRYGFDIANDISGELVENNPFLSLKWSSGDMSSVVQTQLTGAYNAENILAAIAIGVYFGLTKEEIDGGISGYLPKNNRSQILRTENNTLICDFYNANASSMAAALE